MPIETHAFPGLFGGVSQQIPAMRHPTQCAAQVNGISTQVDGLYKRPGFSHVATLAPSGPSGGYIGASGGAAYGHTIETSTGARFQLLLVDGSLCLYNESTGAVQDVQFPHGTTYLSTSTPEDSFRCVTAGNQTFIVNRAKVPALASAVSLANPTDVVYVAIRTAVIGIIYTVTINGITVGHTTGTSGVTNGTIASGLVSALQAALPGFSIYIIPGTTIIRVGKIGVAMACAVSDSWSGTTMQSLTAGVPRYGELPPSFEPGYTLTVGGTAEDAAEEYYVRWAGAKWQETIKPGIRTTIDATTMPHQLIQAGSSWVFQRATWASRTAGNEATCPIPSFIGEPVRNVFYFRNRLGVLAGDSMILSRPGDFSSFWPSSGNQVLATDPIDIAAPGEQSRTLENVTPYHQDLLVWSDGPQQYTLPGGDVLTSADARLVPTTAFPASAGTRPVAVGNKVMFLANAGAYSQLHVYRTQVGGATNYTEDFTQHVPRFIPAGPRQVAVSREAKMLVVVPAGASREFHMLRYELDEQDQFTQRAWGTLYLDSPDDIRIIHASWYQRTLYLVLWVAGRYILQALRLDESIPDTNCGFSLRLDQKALGVVGSFDGTHTTVDAPYLAPVGSLTYLKCIPGLEPEVLVAAAEVPDAANNRTRARLPGDLTGVTVWAGRKFGFKYTFTEAILRDTNSVPIMAAGVKLVRILVRYVSTGWFKATSTPLLRETSTYPMEGRLVGRPGQGATQLALSTGTFAIPVHTKAPDAVVSIESDSYLPVKLPYAEWVGDITYKAARR